MSFFVKLKLLRKKSTYVHLRFQSSSENILVASSFYSFIILGNCKISCAFVGIEFRTFWYVVRCYYVLLLEISEWNWILTNKGIAVLETLNPVPFISLKYIMVPSFSSFLLHSRSETSLVFHIARKLARTEADRKSMKRVAWTSSTPPLISL